MRVFIDTKRQGRCLCIQQDLLTYWNIMPVQHFSLRCALTVLTLRKAHNQRIFHCLEYGSLIIKSFQPKDVGLRPKKSKKHEATSLPVDIKVVHICTFTQFFKVSEYRCSHLTITRLRKRSPLVIAVHHHLLPFVLSSVARWHWWFLSEYLIPLSLSLCHNHCSLWSVCPFCPFKKRHIMRALEDCVSGLFSYADKISSLIPRSLTRLPTNTPQLSTVIVCPTHKVTLDDAGAIHTFKIHVGALSPVAVHQ